MLAASLMGQHRFAEARAVTERLVVLDSGVRPARAMLGEIQLELGEYAAARPDIRHAVRLPGRPGGRAPLCPLGGDSRAAGGGTADPAAAGARRSDAGDTGCRLRSSPGSTGAWATWRSARAPDARPSRSSEPGSRRGTRGSSAAGRAGPAGAGAGPLARGDRLSASAPSRRRSTRRRSACLYHGLRRHRRQAQAPRNTSGPCRSPCSASSRDQFHRAWGLLLLDRGRRGAGGAGSGRARDRPTRATSTAGICWPGRSTARAATRRPRTRWCTRSRWGPGTPMLFFHAGMIDAALGRRESARRHLEMALAINPRWHPFQPDEAREILGRLTEPSARGVAPTPKRASS